MVKLADKQMALRVVEARVASLQAKYKGKQKEKDELEAAKERTKKQLNIAEKLVSGLGSEEKRWEDTAVELKEKLTNLVGNVLLSVGSISYLGPFTQPYRTELTEVRLFSVRVLFRQEKRGCLAWAEGGGGDARQRIARMPFSRC